MGKKKERTMPGPGKRRTVLQIEGPSVSSKKGYGQSSGANALSGLMANYGDSDDEQEYTPPSLPDSKPDEAPAKPKTAMDAKLADFLAEIDAMDTASNSPSGEIEDGKPVEDESIDGKPVNSDDLDGTEVQGSTNQAVAEADGTAEVANPELTAVGEWQELLDENTNCVYYWNMYSNEVTWEMPEAFKLQQEQLASAAVTLPVEPETNAVDAHIPASSDVDTNARDVPNGDIDGVEVPNGFATEHLLAKMTDAVGEVPKDEVEKLPVYGTARVKYQLDPVPDELAEIVKDDLKSQDDDDDDEEREQEEEKIVPVPRKHKLSYVSQFTKGETILPATMDANNSKADVDEQTEKVKEEEMEEDDEEEDEEEDDGRYDLHNEPDEEEEEDKKEEKDELYAMDMFADEMDDIDKQLEMALEKKKAELKELEEAEVKMSPESPKSDKGKKRKSDVVDMASIYDESGSVDLSRFKKKRLEKLEKQKSSGTTQEAGVQCDLQDELTPEEKDKAKEKKKKREEKEKKEEIVEMVSTMMNKLEFLGISTKGLNKFQVMLIEMETRIQDWREGILESKHLLQRLETSDWELQRYETEAAPNGWLCSWDRTHKQYYYTNMASNESQWDYPMEAAAEDAKGEESTVTREETRIAFSSAADRGSVNDDDRNSGEESMDEGNSSDEEPALPNPAEIQLPPALPPSPTQPPPPMPQEDADSPLPPPPLPDGPPPPPPPGEEPALPPLPPSPPPSTPPPAPPPEEGDNVRPLTPPPFLATFSGPAAALAQPPPPPQPAARDTSTAVIGKPQVLYSAPAVTKGAATIAAAPVLSAPATAVSAPPVPQQPAAPPARTKKKKKKEKEPKLVKSKLPHSLVSKWSKIKEEQEKEMEESEESEEEDLGVRNQKMIADWKKEQMVMGKMKYNANFQQIQGDWRERLKRKSKAKP